MHPKPGEVPRLWDPLGLRMGYHHTSHPNALILCGFIFAAALDAKGNPDDKPLSEIWVA